MSTHTPGPWAYDGIKHIVDAEGDRLAFVNCGAPEYPTPLSQGQGEANARLIAAAPDMLTALRNVRSYLTQARSGYDMREIDAAIAKAEGVS